MYSLIVKPFQTLGFPSPCLPPSLLNALPKYLCQIFKGLLTPLPYCGKFLSEPDPGDKGTRAAKTPSRTNDLRRKGAYGMAEQFSEIITEEKAVIDSLRPLIASRVMCKMQIPRTDESWITLLLEIRNIGNTYHLLIAEKGGVPCRFNTRIIACSLREILSELPRVIHRIQRRRYFRVEAPLGMEIIFLTESSKEERKAKVKDYSAGGVAFFAQNDWKLNGGDWLTDIRLDIPEGEGVIRFQIPRAAVRRIESESSHGKKTLCAIEFTEIPEPTRNNIFAHAWRQQRVGIQRIGT
jgi:hypothetical protein